MTAKEISKLHALLMMEISKLSPSKDLKGGWLVKHTYDAAKEDVMKLVTDITLKEIDKCEE